MSSKLNYYDYSVILLAVLLEAFALSMFKNNSNYLMAIVIYCCVAAALGLIINKKGLVAGHAIYDFLGVLVVSCVGFFYFKEPMTIRKIAGLIMGGLAVYLLDKPHSHH